MNEDNVKKANERFEERSGAKVPPPRRSTRDFRTGSAEDEHPSDDPRRQKPMARPRPGDAEPQGDWPEPEPIRNELRSVAPLRAEMIPEPLRSWITDIAYRMQCPLDFVASAALCMMSGVIGAGCTIRPKERDNWAVVPNLWGGVIGRPGMKKTPAIEDAFRPLRRLEAEAKKQHEDDASSHEAEQAAFESQRKALKREMDKRAAKGQDMEEIKEHYANLKPLGRSEAKALRDERRND